jgi:hypothetical protein
MYVVVEPRDGHELERVITKLVNFTGVVHHLIDTIECQPGTEERRSSGS